MKQPPRRGARLHAAWSRTIARARAAGRRTPLILAAAMFAAGVIGWGAFNTAMEATKHAAVLHLMS
jgi:nitrate/TMAO reductase-like tetraheme cytochrome c subunit